jgi:hypothetical protein
MRTLGRQILHQGVILKQVELPLLREQRITAWT